MTTASGVAVVATQLAQTDRRALSQAWYSALHLAHAEHAPPGAPRPAAPATSHAPLPQRVAASPAHGERAALRSPERAVRVPRAAPPIVERRGLPTDAMRRVERAVASIARSPRRPSRTVAIDGGRVTVLVRTDPDATRIVALCREPLRATVERALARARFALAAR
jgi:hypothetical protein